MKTLITLSATRPDAATDTSEKNPATSRPFSKSSGQPEGSSWSDHSQLVQPAEEDLYDPDLAVGFIGTRGYMLQPG